MLHNRSSSGFSVLKDGQNSSVAPLRASSTPVDQDRVHGHATSFTSTEDALRQLVVDLTGQNANLRIDLEVAVKEGMKYREILKEWAALEQQKILVEKMRKKTSLNENAPVSKDLQVRCGDAIDDRETRLLFDTTARIQQLLEDTLRNSAVNGKSVAAYVRSLKQLSHDESMREAEVSSLRREEHKLKRELEQTTQQSNERMHQMQIEILNGEKTIKTLQNTVAQLTKKVEAGEAELKKRDSCVSELISSHAAQLNSLHKEIKARDATVDSLREEARRASTEKTMACIAHTEAAKDAQVRLEQVSALKQTVRSLNTRQDELLAASAERAQKLQTEIESRNREIAALHATLEQLSRDAKGLQEEVEERDKSLNKAEARRAIDLDRHARDIEAKDAAIGMLMDEVARAVAEKDAEFAKNESLVQELRARSEQVAALQDTAKGLAAENDSLSRSRLEKVQKMRTEIQSRDLRIAALNEVLAQLGRDADGLRAELKGRDQRLVELEARRASELEEALEAARTRNSTISALTDQVTQLNADRANSAEAYAQAARELLACGEQVSALENAVRALKVERNEMSQAALERTRQKQTEIQSRDMRIMALNEQTVQLSRDADALRSALQKREEEAALHLGERDRINRELQSLGRIITAVREENERLTAELVSNRATADGYRALQENTAGADAERIQTLLEELESRDAHILALQDTLLSQGSKLELMNATAREKELHNAQVAHDAEKARKTEENLVLSNEVAELQESLIRIKEENIIVTSHMEQMQAAHEMQLQELRGENQLLSSQIAELKAATQLLEGEALSLAKERDSVWQDWVLAKETALIAQKDAADMLRELEALRTSENAERVRQSFGQQLSDVHKEADERLESMQAVLSAFETALAGIDLSSKSTESSLVYLILFIREMKMQNENFIMSRRHMAQTLADVVENLVGAKNEMMTYMVLEEQMSKRDIYKSRSDFGIALLRCKSLESLLCDTLEALHLIKDEASSIQIDAIQVQSQFDSQLQAYDVMRKESLDLQTKLLRTQTMIVHLKGNLTAESKFAQTQLEVINMKIDSLEECFLNISGNIDQVCTLSNQEKDVMENEWNATVISKDSEIFALKNDVDSFKILLQDKEADIERLQSEVKRFGNEFEKIFQRNNQFQKFQECILEELNDLKISSIQSVNQFEDVLSGLDQHVERFKEHARFSYPQSSLCDTKYILELVQSKDINQITATLQSGEIYHEDLAYFLVSSCMDSNKELAELLSGLKQCSSFDKLLQSIDSDKISTFFSYLPWSEKKAMVSFLPVGLQDLAESAIAFHNLSPSERAKLMVQMNKLELANLIKWLSAEDIGPSCSYLTFSDLEDLLRLLPAKGDKRVQMIINMPDSARLASINFCTPEEKADIIVSLNRAAALTFMYEMQRCELKGVFTSMQHLQKSEIELALEISDAICEGKYEVLESVKAAPYKYVTWIRPKIIAKIVQNRTEEGLDMLEQLTPEVIALVIEELLPSYRAQVLCCLSTQICKLVLSLTPKKLLSRILSTITDEQMDVLICRFPKASHQNIKTAIMVSKMVSGKRCSTLTGLNTQTLDDVMQWLDPERVGEYLSELPKEDAQLLLTGLSPAVRNSVFDSMDAVQRSKCLCLLSPAHRTTVLRSFTPEQILATLEVMSSKEQNTMLASMPTEERKCLLRANELNRLPADERCLALAAMKIRECTVLLQWIEPKFAAEYLRLIPLQRKLPFFNTNVNSCWNDCKDPWTPDFVATLFVTMTQQDSLPIIAQMRPSKLVQVFEYLDEEEARGLVSNMSPGDKVIVCESLSLQTESIIQRNFEAVDIDVSRSHPIVRRKLHLLKEDKESFVDSQAKNATSESTK